MKTRKVYGIKDENGNEIGMEIFFESKEDAEEFFKQYPEINDPGAKAERMYIPVQYNGEPYYSQKPGSISEDGTERVIEDFSLDQIYIGEWLICENNIYDKDVDFIFIYPRDFILKTYKNITEE